MTKGQTLLIGLAAGAALALPFALSAQDTEGGGARARLLRTFGR